jgi:TonB family protein
MNATTADVLAARSPIGRQGLNRMIGWSFALHLGVIVFLIVAPKEWFTRDEPQMIRMSINLGTGIAGPRSTGMTSAPARTVEQVAPATKQPIPPAARKPEPAPAKQEPVKPTPSKPDTTKPVSTAVTPAAVGQQIQQGTAKVETGSKTEGTGLSFGGQGGQSAELDLTQFCCPWYIQTLLEKIDREWNKRGNQGITRIQFTIERDGTISRKEWIQRSGIVSQDIEAMRAVQTIRMPPLPQEFTERQLTIRMTFNYGGQ